MGMMPPSFLTWKFPTCWASAWGRGVGAYPQCGWDPGLARCWVWEARGRHAESAGSGPQQLGSSGDIHSRMEECINLE